MQFKSRADGVFSVEVKSNSELEFDIIFYS